MFWLFSAHFVACKIQSTGLAVSPERCLGRVKGASAPYFIDCSFISLLSEEIITLSIYLDWSASIIVYAINGWPLICLIFFLELP